MLQVVSWWAAVEALGLLALPLSLKVFRNLPDKGYAFSKILGLLCFSYVIWLSASTRLLPNHRLTMLFFLLAFSSLFVLWLRRHPATITKQLQACRPAILTTEIVFLSTFVLWIVVRSYSPAILATEKPMDFAFLNSILRTSYFPPPDPWLSGFSLNNYYFGHCIVAVLTKLTDVPSAVGFNLAIALIFSLVAIGIFSLVYNLICARNSKGQRQAIAFGLLGIMLVLIAGNLEGILELFYSRGAGSPEFWKWLNIKGLVQPYVSGQWYPTEHWWWWRATRVIDTFVNGQSLDYTITEFPIFSFLLADMHAHLLALPFALMVLALSFNVLLNREPISLRQAKRNPADLVFVMISLGSLGVIHTWDLPSYAAIFITCVFLQHYLTESRFAHQVGMSPTYKWWQPAAVSIIILAGIFLYYLPFYYSFQRPVTGILPWLGPGTRPLYLVILYGLFGFIGISTALSLSRIPAAHTRDILKALGILIPFLLVPLLIWTLIKVPVGVVTTGPTTAAFSVLDRWRNLLPLILVMFLFAWVLIAKAQKAKETGTASISDLYMLILMLAGVLLIYGTDLFFVRDVVFGNRINTVFRFHYQAWVFLSLTAAYGLYHMANAGNNLSIIRKLTLASWWGLTVLLIASSLFYPVAATINRSNFSGRATIDGLGFLNNPEREAIKWLKDNAPENAVVLEAYGEAYSEGGRISEWTGIPTVLAWSWHQKIWRGTDEDFKDRARDIDTMFRSNNPQETRVLLAKYKITHIYIGGLEQRTYGEQSRTRFSALANAVFQNQSAIILRVREQ